MLVHDSSETVSSKIGSARVLRTLRVMRRGRPSVVCPKRAGIGQILCPVFGLSDFCRNGSYGLV